MDDERDDARGKGEVGGRGSPTGDARESSVRELCPTGAHLALLGVGVQHFVHAIPPMFMALAAVDTIHRLKRLADFRLNVALQPVVRRVRHVVQISTG